MSPRKEPVEQDFGVALRPRTLDEFAGQDRIKESLRILIEAAKGRSEPPDHILICGPAGLGKTTLAHVIANELGANIRLTSGPVLERASDMAAILTNLHKGDVFLIDMLDRVIQPVEEVLYSVLEEFALDLVIGEGPGARNIRLALRRFTMIGTTREFESVSPLLRTRFGNVLRLDYYDTDAIEKIVRRSAGILGVPIDDKAAKQIASKARGMPREAHRLVKRVRDYAQVRADGVITQTVALDALALLEME